MNREPIALYIFRFILGLGLFAFMAMLYWSSVLVETRLQEVKSDLGQIKNEIHSVRSDMSKMQIDLLKNALENSTYSENRASKPMHTLTKTSHYENLLFEDPFYNNTLPKLLGPDFKPQGTRREAEFGKPDHLHPFAIWRSVIRWYGLCSVSVGKLETGKYESYTQDMASRLELRENEKGEPEYWIFLRQDVFWQPLKQSFFGNSLQLASHFLRKHPVTAHDFKFFYDAVMNMHVSETGAAAMRVSLQDIEEFKVIDDYTFTVKWKTKEIEENGQVVSRMKYASKSSTCSLRPLASFIYQYFPDGKKIIEDDSDPETYRTNPIWAQNFSNHWAKNVIPSCGAWEFDGMSDQEIRFKRNQDFYQPYAALCEKIEYKFKNSQDAIWEEFKQGSFDTFEIPAYQLAEYERFIESAPYKEQVAKGLKIDRLDYVQQSYAYIGWNEARPFFESQKVRQALTYAIDRERIIRQNLNGMGLQTTGTFFIYSPSYDTSLQPYAYDPEKALQLLHEEGWYDSDGDGILNKVIDGKNVSFSFTLTYYVKNTITKAICEYVSNALKEIGIQCILNGVEVADLSAIFEDKNFDAFSMLWGLVAPPENPRQLWYSNAAQQKGSSNAISFANAEVDSLIDKLDYEYDPKKRIELYHAFDRILYEEAPYTFLYTPKKTLLYRNYLQNVFIPADRQDLIPGANMGEPLSDLFWIKESEN